MRADVVVVGAGLAGAALADRLAGAGLAVVLLEKDYPGLGTSGRSAGFVTIQHWDRIDVDLARTAAAFYEDLMAGEGGVQVTGFLRATSEEADRPLMERRVALYQEEGVEARLVEGEEIASRYPALEPTGLAAGLLTPADGFVDAYDATRRLTSRARDRGAELRTTTRVKGLRTAAGRLTGVETSRGELASEEVVVAAGPWTPALLRGSGVALPLKPYRVQALTTAPLPEVPVLPMYHELPEGRYLRPDQESLLLGDGSEHAEADPGSYNTHADFRLHTEIASWVARRLPGLGDVRMARGWAGLCVATPDRFPLVGAVAAVDGLHVLAGFNGLGVMRAPALARALADLLLRRRPAVDLAPFSPDRFPEDVDFAIREGFTLQGNDAPPSPAPGA